MLGCFSLELLDTLSSMKKWLFGILLCLFPIFFAGCSLPNLNPKASLKVEIFDNLSSEVYLNGKLVGNTPYSNNSLKPGSYNLEIKPVDKSLTGYTTTISLSEAVISVVSWKLGTQPETSGGTIVEMQKIADSQSSELSIKTIPDGSIVQVDQQAQGFSPVVLSHEKIGSHQYLVGLPSYETQANSVNVTQGYRTNLTIKLARQTTSNDNLSNNQASPAATPVLGLPDSTITNSTLASLSAQTNLFLSATSSTNTIPTPKVKINPTGLFQNGQEILHIRSKPSQSSNSPGVANVGQEFPYLNQSTNGWYKITYLGQTAWVSSQFATLIK